MGERLQLDWIRSKAMAFIQAELKAGRSGLQQETASLSLLPSGLLARVITELIPPLQPVGGTHSCAKCEMAYTVAHFRGISKCPKCRHYNMKSTSV